jgi:hypothetical protein
LKDWGVKSQSVKLLSNHPGAGGVPAKFSSQSWVWPETIKTEKRSTKGKKHLKEWKDIVMDKKVKN